MLTSLATKVEQQYLVAYYHLLKTEKDTPMYQLAKNDFKHYGEQIKSPVTKRSIRTLVSSVVNYENRTKMGRQ